MNIPWDAEGIFRSRPNRFLALVDVLEGTDEKVNGESGYVGRKIVSSGEKVHVHDPGRLEEILVPGSGLLLRRAPEGTQRKTGWDVIAGRYGGNWVLINSALHRAISETVLRSEAMNPFGKLKEIRPEVKVGHSRLDFLLTRDDGTEIWVEVKGCTLAMNGRALFPDAPTERGRRHLETLMELRETRGNAGAALLVLVFRKDAECFAPNAATDPKFAAAFHEAVEKGIEVHPLVFGFEGNGLFFVGEIPICKG